MKYALKLTFLICFVLQLSIREVSAQRADTSSFLKHKHQVGFNATEAIKLFEEDIRNVYKVYYRYKLSADLAIRSGLNYSLDTSGSGMLELDSKIGFDKIFKESGSWRFYSGLDFLVGFEKFSSSGRRNYAAGLSPFLGVIFYASEHFSISTEPGVSLEVKHFKNTTTLNPDNSEIWIEMELINVGQLIFSVHF